MRNSLVTVVMLFMALLLLSCQTRSSEDQPIESQSTKAADEVGNSFQKGLFSVSSMKGQLVVLPGRMSTTVDRQVAELPIERIVVSSTTQLPYFKALKALDRVVGCPWLAFVDDPDVMARVDTGQLVDITKGASMDLEKIIALEPDLLLYDPRESDLIPQLQDQGNCMYSLF